MLWAYAQIKNGRNHHDREHKNAAEQAVKNEETANAVIAHIKDVKEALNKMTLAQLRHEADHLCRLYNDATDDDNTKAQKEIDKFLPDVLSALNDECRVQCFAELKAEPDPIIAACKRLTYTGYRVKDEKSLDGKTTTRKLSEADRNIDLLKLHKFMDRVSGKNSNWPYMIEDLNLRLTIRVIKEVTKDDKDKTAAQKIEAKKAEIIASYKMSDTARQMKMGASVENNTQLGRAMQKCIEAMVGDVGKVRTHDVRWLVHAFTKTGKAPCSLKCSNHATLTRVMMHVIHAMITEDFEYGVEYDKVKK